MIIITLLCYLLCYYFLFLVIAIRNKLSFILEFPLFFFYNTDFQFLNFNIISLKNFNFLKINFCTKIVICQLRLCSNSRTQILTYTCTNRFIRARTIDCIDSKFILKAIIWHKIRELDFRRFKNYIDISEVR